MPEFDGEAKKMSMGKARNFEANAIGPEAKAVIFGLDWRPSLVSSTTSLAFSRLGYPRR